MSTLQMRRWRFLSYVVMAKQEIKLLHSNVFVGVGDDLRELDGEGCVLTLQSSHTFTQPTKLTDLVNII